MQVTGKPKANGKKAIDELRTAEQHTVNAYKDLFNSAQGQIVLKDLLEMFYDPSCIALKADAPVDPYLTVAREGAREVMIYIRNLIGEA